MVALYWVMIILAAALPAYGDVRVQAEADKVDHFENMPVPVTIIVTHPPAQDIDESTFTMGKETIAVEKVKDVSDSSGQGDVLSIYRYNFPNKGKGLHVLPSITVKVGGKLYKTIASTFEVKAMDGAGSSAPASTATSSGAFLKLENIVEGSKVLYPGQMITVGYRYSYNANIETTNEDTPLFAPNGFLKVGDKVVNHKDTADTSVLEVTQQLQAQEPGAYQVGPSSIEGYVYTEDSLGRRAYSKNKLKSVAPAVTLTVKGLPAENRPASFNGAVGKYSFKVTLKTPASVTVGDEMTLQIEISGTGDLQTVQLPELCCQPGMSGVFKLSDLPPVGKVEGNVKIFSVDLRPLTPAATAIPSLEFSFFDPEEGKYQAVHSQAIPVKVAELKVPQGEENPLPAKEKGSWRQEPAVAPIEVEGNYPLTPEDLQNRWFSSWWMLLLAPVAAFLLMYQNNLKRFFAARKAVAPQSDAAALFLEAWEEAPHTSPFYAKLYQAFFMRLQERGDIPASVNSIDRLPAEGAAGDVKALLSAIEEARYAGDKGVREGQLLAHARRLFKELEV